eukprot:CAMPEP_0183350568 /NCGR_PEP_ID=MMETSP0164_2-20130417/20537_1 /TAXON_ID=221442 /ORGANISM="Coccolithus pelagicus ssp braarudi, Strain PLY182g" /LENGTH=412 /DNA_ID=CAMNT_0025522531 /DNA_START=42 /DNA_END=1280 /DNA_ORIENTATION=+
MGKGGQGKVAKTEKVADEPLNVYLYGKSIDISKFIHKHPGGAKALHIFQNRDATEQFEMYHSPVAHKMMQAMSKDAPDAPAESAVATTDIGRDFAALTKHMEDLGYFKADYADEAFKLFLTLMPGFIGARLLHSGMPVLGAFLMGFSFYLSGWTSHDYLHHSVIKGSSKRMVHWNNAIGYLLGPLWQGYAVEWWRARHNTHHLVTNEDGNDPDIKTAPVLVYVRNTPSIARALNAVQRWQQYYYVPVMAILDVYWRAESIAYLAVRPFHKHKASWLLLAIHYATLAYLFQGKMAYMALMMLVRGFLTGIVVFATHYGEDIIDGGDHKMTLVKQTALTSRNITGGYMMNILTGFISLQTEHHLWPMMPTAHLSKAQVLTRSFFKKWDLEYRESNLVECVWYNIRALRYEHLLH